MSRDDKREIFVCSECRTASCFNGITYCERYLTAHAVKITVYQAKSENRERARYYGEESNR